mmetsp:Transcript_25863/g.66558  ORF Transcript_25863/g.66558 Transcript_25863/m.66558 type:complete len:375 (+) Transcript_25863:257-1381(+)
MARSALPLLLLLGSLALTNAGLWDIEGRFACGSVQLYGIDFFDGLTFNPSTNTMWVATRGGLLEFNLSGEIIRRVPARALRRIGADAVTGVKWLEGSALLVAHRDQALVSVIDTSDDGDVVVVESMPVREPASTSLAGIPGASGIVISYPSNLTEVYRVDRVDGEARFFTDEVLREQVRDGTPIDYTSMHFATDQGTLLALSRGVGRFPGAITEIDASGNYVSYPLWGLVTDLVPKSLEFLPSGSVMFLAGRNRESELAEVQFFCAADVRDTPGMFRSTVWSPIIRCLPGACARTPSSKADPADLGFGADDVKSMDDQPRSSGTAVLGESDTPPWLQQWFNSSGDASAPRAGDPPSVACGRYIFYEGYGYRWEE